MEHIHHANARTTPRIRQEITVYTPSLKGTPMVPQHTTSRRKLGSLHASKSRFLLSQECDPLSQTGSAIIWIFIMVALFAALSFVVAKGMRGNTGDLDKKRAELAATEILDYARNMKQAVQTLQINGCEDTEVSFDNAVLSGYSNPNAPIDESCHVFKPNGGGLRYRKVERDWLDDTYAGGSSFQSWVGTGNVAITNIGSTNLDLLLYVPYLKSDICKKINKILNISEPVPIDLFSASEFIGNYTASVQPEIGDEAAILAGKTIFCAKRASSTWYYFGQVLIAR